MTKFAQDEDLLDDEDDDEEEEEEASEEDHKEVIERNRKAAIDASKRSRVEKSKRTVEEEESEKKEQENLRENKSYIRMQVIVVKKRCILLYIFVLYHVKKHQVDKSKYTCYFTLHNHERN